MGSKLLCPCHNAASEILLSFALLLVRGIVYAGKATSSIDMFLRRAVEELAIELCDHLVAQHVVERIKCVLARRLLCFMSNTLVAVKSLQNWIQGLEKTHKSLFGVGYTCALVRSAAFTTVSFISTFLRWCIKGRRAWGCRRGT